MIKKLLAAAFCVCFVLSLCGCDGYRETDGCYIVTAVGFDKTEKMKVSVEVVSTGGGERSNAPYSEIILGEGETPESAIFSLSSKISKILMFDHCTAIIIGDSIDPADFDGIVNFASDLKEINLSVYIVRTESAENLLKDSQPMAVARGFDIAGNIKETEKDTGINYKNRFFELFAAYKNGDFYNTPVLEVKDKKIIINGESVFQKEKKSDLLTNEESLLYSFISNNNSGGKIYFGKEYADVSSCRCTPENGEYLVSVKIKNESEGFKKAFSEKCSGFLKDHREKLGLKFDKIDVKIKGGA